MYRRDENLIKSQQNQIKNVQKNLFKAVLDEKRKIPEDLRLHWSNQARQSRNKQQNN